LGLPVIHLVIALVAEIVISSIFNSCDGEDQNQRHDGGEPGKGGHLWDQLQNEKEQEVGIGDLLELLKEVDRQEGENIVLGGLDAITRVLEFLIVFSVVGSSPPFFFCNRTMMPQSGGANGGLAQHLVRPTHFVGFPLRALGSLQSTQF